MFAFLRGDVMYVEKQVALLLWESTIRGDMKKLAQKPTILIVEDNEHNHKLYRDVFERGGFEVTLRENADGFLVEEVANLNPDIISMDLMMGKDGAATERDGFDALEQLKAEDLPLQQGLSTGNYAFDNKIQVMILKVTDDKDFIHAKAGLFYTSIIGGCSCADDPTPIDENNEYCEILCIINKNTADTTIQLMKT